MTSAGHAPAPAGLFDFVPRTRLVFGAGSVARVGELARELGGRRVLLVTDTGIVKAGHAGHVQEALAKAGLHVSLFDRAKENPTTKCVDECVAVAAAEQVDLLIGLGGGSSMDTAKGCNFIFTNGGRMQDYWGVGKAKKPMLPLIAIPTTAGTGSECQSAALIARLPCAITSPSRTAVLPVPTRTSRLPARISPGARSVVSVTSTGARRTRESARIVQAPGAGVDARMSPSTCAAG